MGIQTHRFTQMLTYMLANTHTKSHTHIYTHRELRQMTASAPRPQVQWWPLRQPHLPLSCLILLVGSIIWLAVWVPVSCFPGDSQGMGARRHWAEASLVSAAAVWETARGAAQMWESGANRRYGWFQCRPCLLFHLFLGGRSRPLIWLTAKHLAFVPEMNNCKENEAQRKTGEKRKKDLGPEEKSVDQVQNEAGHSILH